MTNTNTTYAQNFTALDRNFAETIIRQSWSQTRAIERRIWDTEPVWTNGDNGESEPWDWIHGEYTALYLLPKYGYIAYNRTGAGGVEACETEDGCFVGGSALYAVNPSKIDMLTRDRTNNPCDETVAEHLQYHAIKLVYSRG